MLQLGQQRAVEQRHFGAAHELCWRAATRLSQIRVDFFELGLETRRRGRDVAYEERELGEDVEAHFFRFDVREVQHRVWIQSIQIVGYVVHVGKHHGRRAACVPRWWRVVESEQAAHALNKHRRLNGQFAELFGRIVHVDGDHVEVELVCLCFDQKLHEHVLAKRTCAL